MQIIGFFVYLVLQILFVPITVIGLLVGLYKEMYISKKRGVSFSAGQALQYRWIMHMFDSRKDPNTIAFVKAFPCESHFALWAVMGPFIIAHKLCGFQSTFNKKVPYGFETLDKIAGNRVLLFDDIFEKHMDSIDQVVLPGAGYDLIAQKYTKDNDIKVFELDQSKTIRLKLETLDKANIQHDWITYIPVDYAAESWCKKLLENGFDSSKKTLFLWQSVSLYLEEEQVRESIETMKALSSPGSVIVQDFYATAFLDGSISKIAIKNMNMIAKQGEPWLFSLDMEEGYKQSITRFLSTCDLNVTNMYNFGEQIDIRPHYSIVESIIT